MAGGNNFDDFAENQLSCVPENISFQKIWGQNTTFDPQLNFRGSNPPVPAPLNHMYYKAAISTLKKTKKLIVSTVEAQK